MVLDPSFSFKKGFPSILLILGFGMIVYVNSFQGPFILDDDWTTVKNPVIKSLDNFYANNTGYEFLPNRYVATLSLVVKYSHGGFDVTGYHVVVLVIHLLSALLVSALLMLTFQLPYLREQRESALQDELALNWKILFLPFIMLFRFFCGPTLYRATCSSPGGDLCLTAYDLNDGQFEGLVLLTWITKRH